MFMLFIFTWFLVFVGCIFSTGSQSTENDAYGDSSSSYDYYGEESAYGYYEDESGNNSQRGDGYDLVEEVIEDTPVYKRGYRKPVGGGILQVMSPILNEAFLNDTIERYSCLPMKDSRLKIAEMQPNMTLVVNADGTESFVPENVELERVESELESRREDLMKSYEAMDQEFNVTEATIDKDTKLTSFEKQEKKLSFRELQEKKRKERAEKDRIRDAKIPKVQLGPACESMICSSCKFLVEEFAKSVVRGVDDAQLSYVEEVFKGFCAIKEVRLKYTSIVSDMCNELFMDEKTGYQEALIRPFEEDEAWDDVAKFPGLFQKMEKVCVEVGACTQAQFQLNLQPRDVTQEQWDDKCFVCQAFAENVEERVAISRYITETSIVGVVAETCDRLNLEPKYDELCRPMVQGKMLDDIAWMASLHGESMINKVKDERHFADYMCQEIKYCSKWVDPEYKKALEEREVIEVFF